MDTSMKNAKPPGSQLAFRTCKTTVIVTFECDTEAYNRLEFQAAGHFVPGTCTGPDVYALNLMAADGIQLARVLAPSLDEAETAMESRIRDLVTANARQSQIGQFSYEAYTKLVREVGDLANFMAFNYGEGANSNLDAGGSRPVPANPVAWAMNVMARERARWHVRLRRWVARQLSSYQRPAPAGGEGEDQ